MYMTIRNNEKLLIESTRHKVEVIADSSGEITYSEVGKYSLKVKELLFEKQLKELVEKNVGSGWEEERLKPMIAFIKDIVEKGSNALKIDKNKLFTLMVENCNYSAINYFQKYNFYDFNSASNYEGEISKLNLKIRELTQNHKKEIIELQKDVTFGKSVEGKKNEENNIISNNN